VVRDIHRDRKPFSRILQEVIVRLNELKGGDVIIILGEGICYSPIPKREIRITAVPHRWWRTENEQLISIRTKTGTFAGLPHRENRGEENHVLPMHNPLGAGRIQSVREEGVLVSIMSENHHGAPVVEFRTIVGIPED
jgi:hypothetical protein